MKILANENIPAEVVKKLKNKGFDVERVDNIKIGMTDDEVIKFASKQGFIILSYDKDFGEKVFRSQQSVKGVILLRIRPLSSSFIFQRLSDLFAEFPEIDGKFIVIEENRIRVKEIHIK